VEFLEILLLLVPHAVLLLVGWEVVRAAGRRPLTTAALIAVAVAAGTGAIWFAAAAGYSPPTRGSGPVPFGWPPVCFGVGVVLVILGFPALLLVPDAAVRGPKAAAGPFLFAYWFACVVFAMVLQSWLTGQVK
jgi:hypothetical protein